MFVPTDSFLLRYNLGYTNVKSVPWWLASRSIYSFALTSPQKFPSPFTQRKWLFCFHQWSLVLPVRELHLYRIMQHIIFYVWLLLLNLMFLKLISTLLCVSVPLYDSHIIYLYFCWWTFGLFPVFIFIVCRPTHTGLLMSMCNNFSIQEVDL